MLCWCERPLKDLIVKCLILQGAEALPVSPVQNETQSHGQKVISSGGAEKNPPVQETDPAPQALMASQVDYL